MNAEEATNADRAALCVAALEKVPSAVLRKVLETTSEFSPHVRLAMLSGVCEERARQLQGGR